MSASGSPWESSSAVKSFGEDAGCGRLANASRTCEEVGVGDAVRQNGATQRVGDVFLTDDVAEAGRPPLSVKNGAHTRCKYP